MECVMQIENLEGRRLLSVTVNQTSPGFYEVNGDESDNVIVVSVSQNDQSFTLDGITYTGVNYIYVFGNGGENTIDVSPPRAPGGRAGLGGGGGGRELFPNLCGGGLGRRGGGGSSTLASVYGRSWGS